MTFTKTTEPLGLRVDWIGLGIFLLIAIVGIGISNISTNAATARVHATDRAKVDAIIALKNAADEVGLTVQQLYAYETAAEKAGVSPREWHNALWQFTRKMTEIKTGGYIRNRLIVQGANGYVMRIMATTSTAKMLEETLDLTQAIKKTSGPAVARIFADYVGLGLAGTLLTMSDLNSELSNAPPFTEQDIANAKKLRDEMIDAERK